jgi:V8-like Glu-specific endopeptidase
MRKPLVAALFALVITGAGAPPAVAAPQAAPEPATGTVKTAVGSVVDAANKAVADAASRVAPADSSVQAVNFAGTVSLSNCSGSVVRMPNAEDDDPALVMTNGHCLETGFPGPGEVLVDRASTRSFGLLNSAGTRVATLRANRIVYGTMTDTDMALYRLTTTYGQIKSSYGINALVFDTARPAVGTDITVVSGYWKRTYACDVDGYAYRLKEGAWTWKDSVRYTSACKTIGGTSGSPVLDNATGKVVAVNNTGNEDGGRCTDNNPCEVDANGTVTVREGINYGQQTWHVPACFGADSKLDLTRSGCILPRP